MRYKSKCCDARVKIEGDDKEGTFYFVCTKCDEPCDIKSECPHIRHTGGYCKEVDDYIEGADMCDLVDKFCLLAWGYECDEWAEIQREWKEEGG